LVQYYVVIWYTIFSLFWYVVPRKIWQPWWQPNSLSSSALSARRIPITQIHLSRIDAQVSTYLICLRCTGIYMPNLSEIC
jgi:hypothetical protein